VLPGLVFPSGDDNAKEDRGCRVSAAYLRRRLRPSYSVDIVRYYPSKHSNNLYIDHRPGGTAEAPVPLSLRNVEDPLHEGGVDVGRETGRGRKR
jgi:hypothetical protein